MNGLFSTLLAQNEASGGIGAFIFPLVLLAGFGYMAFVMPRKQRKQREELKSSLEVGAEVVTTGGIYGTITFIEEDEPIIHLAIDTDTVIRVTETAIGRKVSPDVSES